MKKLLISSLVILAFLMQENLLAQKEFNNWFIGDTRLISFNTPNKIPTIQNDIEYPFFWYNSKDYFSNFSNYFSSVSDRNGSLLFYTDGFSVWNKVFQLMLNGKKDSTLFGFGQRPYFSNNLLIVQNPGNFNQYYIFYEVTYQTFYRVEKTILYHIVDITKNGGLGEVIKKNVALADYPRKQSYMSNFGLTGTIHKNQKDVWLITVDAMKSVYQSYLITKDSICNNSVDSKTTNGLCEVNLNRVSSDGEFITSIEGSNLNDSNNCDLYLYKFDRSSGKLNKLEKIPVSNHNLYPAIPAAIEFSPDMSKLYLATCHQNIDLVGDTVFLAQYNMQNLRISSVVFKKYFSQKELKYIDGDDNYIWLDLRLAPNNKIYLSNFEMGDFKNKDGYDDINTINSIGVIDNPNENQKLCNFLENIFFKNSLNENVDRWKLPIALIVFRSLNHKVIGNNVCLNDTIKLMDTGIVDTSNIVFIWSGPNGFTSNSHNVIIPNAQLSNTGFYKLEARYGPLSNLDSIFVIVHPHPSVQIKSQDSQTICEGDSVILKAETDVSNNLLWSTGDAISTITIKKSGSYKVIATNQYGCKDSASIDITVIPPFKATIKGKTSICLGDSTDLLAEPTGLGYKYLWSTDDTSNLKTVNKQGNYSVKISFNDKCSDSTTFYVKVNPLPIVNIIGKTEICPGDSTKLSVDNDFISYSWSTGETTKSIQVLKSGIYSVTVFDSNGCKTVSNFKLSPCVNIIGNRFICFLDTILLSSNADFTSYQWSTLETTKSILITKPGTYSVTVTDSNGCTNSASFEVKQYDIKLTGLTDLDFGSRQAGGSYPLNLTLKNESNAPIQIKSITTKNLTGIFNITTNPPLTEPLDVGSTLDVMVTFKPDLNQFYSDSIIVVIDTPCPATYNSALKGTSKSLTTIFIPDLTAVVGTPYFCIPLMATKDANMIIIDNLSYTAEIRYDATALVPNDNFPVVSGDRVISLSGNNIKFINNEIELGNFCGDVVLANKDVTPLRITQFKWNNPNIDTIIQDGSLTIQGLCQRSIARIEIFNPVEILIKQSIVSNELEISTKNTTNDDILTIYSIIGIEMGNYVCTEQMNIDISGLSTGLYFVRIGEREGKFVKI